jgi:(1->4)-alpha-D-glucan 1-alpha-D-glucosylmutase
MLKATKEAKVNNSWTNHRPEYDDAITGFVERVLAAPADDPFHEEFRRLHRRLVRVGRLNAIAQQFLKIACPGVPDIYQGTESWDLSLVDPDNRRPVDYDQRRAMLEEVAARCGEDRVGFARELIGRPDDPRLKLFVTTSALTARRAAPGLFRDGAYVPLDVVGPRARHVVAFARTHEGRIAIAVAPRLVAALVGDRDAWRDTFITFPDEVAELIDGRVVRDVFTNAPRRAIAREGGTAFAVPELFADFPLALLTRDDS